MKKIAGLYVAWLLAAVMLVFAVIRPAEIGTSYQSHRGFGRSSFAYHHATSSHHARSDFYTLLRWICCAAFTYSAVATFRMKRVVWTWVFGVFAVLFNPIAPVYLQRSTWQIFDYLAIAVIVIAGIVFARTPAQR